MTLERVEPTIDPNAEIADGLVRAAELMNADRFTEARRIYMDLLAKYPEAHQLHRMRCSREPVGESPAAIFS